MTTREILTLTFFLWLGSLAIAASIPHDHVNVRAMIRGSLEGRTVIASVEIRSTQSLLRGSL